MWDLGCLFYLLSVSVCLRLSLCLSLYLCLSLCPCPSLLYPPPFSARLGNKVTYVPIVKTSGLTNKCLSFLLGRAASFASYPENAIILWVSIVGSLCSEEQAAMATKSLAAVASGACGELTLP